MSINSDMTDGFDFSNCKRNKWISTDPNIKNLPKALKTGTTIVGTIFKDGVVLGADTRSTMGSIVADKNCEKIHYIAPNIYCCGAGTAADTENVTKMVSAQLELQRLNDHRNSRVLSALKACKDHLFKYQGYIGAALILGGVDCCGSHLYSVSPHGHSDKLPYTTMGSGCLASMAFFEKNYKENMSEEEAIKFVADGITAGIENDLGSGSNVDICIIKSGGTKYFRNYQIIGQRCEKFNYNFAEGTTAVVKKTIYPHIDFDIISSEIKTIVQDYQEVIMD